MKFWFIAPWVVPEEMIELAKHAEALGFEGLMGADHAFVPEKIGSSYLYSDDGKPPFDASMPFPEVWTTISAMAMVTTRLKFSTSIYILPLRNPVEVAKATGTVARISGNRLILGAGVGWMKEEFDAYGVDFKTRGRRMDECVEVIRKLQAGGFVEHHGEFFDLPGVAVAPAPEQPVPIYFGGTSKPALRRAARLGQGWIGTGNDIDEVPGILERLNTLRREAGRESEPFDVVCPVMQIREVERLKALEEQGLTALCFGFKQGHELPLDEKRGAMDWFAREVMAKF